MFVNHLRPFAAIAAGLLTSLLFVWLDSGLAVERLRVALALA